MTSLMRRDWPDLPDLIRRDLPDLLRRFEPEWDKGWLRVEEFVDGNEHVIRAELPGIDPAKDVEISVADGVLTIRAEREEKTEHKKKDSYRSEFRYGSFTRSVTLPAGATDADVSATYADGVLEVRVPLGEAPRPEPKKIPVTRA